MSLISAREDVIECGYECMVVFVVTHSPEAGQLLCNDDIVHDEDLTNLMEDETLSNLVKIFVFQVGTLFHK